MKENNFILKKGIIKKTNSFFLNEKIFWKKIFSTFVFLLEKKTVIWYLYIQSNWNLLFLSSSFWELWIETLYSKNIDFVDFICNLHGYMYM